MPSFRQGGVQRSAPPVRVVVCPRAAVRARRSFRSAASTVLARRSFRSAASTVLARRFALCHARAFTHRFASICLPPSALTRRRVGLLHSMVNCGPAKRQCLPVLAPAQAFVRAGERRGKCGMRIRSSRLIRAVAFLLGCLALGSRLLCCSTDVPCVLRVPVIAFLSPRIALGSRLLFALRQTGRLAVSRVPVPPGRGRHSCVLGASVRLSASVGSLRVWPFLYGDLDGVTGDAGNGGWRRGTCASLRGRIGLAGLSAGSTLGAARPQTCAKESSTLWTLFTLRRGCVGADSPRQVEAGTARSSAVSLAFALSMPPLFGSATGILPPSSMNAGSAAADL